MLRRWVPFAGAVSLAITFSACGSGAPATVEDSFEAKYPGAQPTWEAQPYGYEAVFTRDGMEYEAEFSQSGEWLETEYEVAGDQFPTLVLDRVRRDYPGYGITKHEVELTPRGTFYEVEVERGGEEGELYYDSMGDPATNANEDA